MKKRVNMKKLSKAFIIISIVFAALIIPIGLIYVFYSLGSSYVNLENLVQGISLLVAGILMIIVGAIALKKIKKATNHSQLVNIGICTLLFCSLWGGMYMLLIKDEELNKEEQNKEEQNKEELNR